MTSVPSSAFVDVFEALRAQTNTTISEAWRLSFDTLSESACASGLNGRVMALSPQGQRQLMLWVRDGTPFAWVRWGDGESIAAGNGDRGLAVSAKAWSKVGQARFFVAIGMWWMCSPFRIGWNEVVSPIAGTKRTHAVLLESFYLPMGDPADQNVYAARMLNISGWIIEAQERIICLVGPHFTERFKSFLHNLEYIRVPTHADDQFVDILLTEMKRVSQKYPSQGVLYPIIAGSVTKVAITKAFQSSWGSKNTYIDVGSALDGYAGIASKDFINIPRYCKSIQNYVTDEKDHKLRSWMKSGVCDDNGPQSSWFGALSYPAWLP